VPLLNPVFGICLAPKARLTSAWGIAQELGSDDKPALKARLNASITVNPTHMSP